MARSIYTKDRFYTLCVSPSNHNFDIFGLPFSLENELLINCIAFGNEHLKILRKGGKPP